MILNEKQLICIMRTNYLTGPTRTFIFIYKIILHKTNELVLSPCLYDHILVSCVSLPYQRENNGFVWCGFLNA